MIRIRLTATSSEKRVFRLKCSFLTNCSTACDDFALVSSDVRGLEDSERLRKQKAEVSSDVRGLEGNSIVTLI